MTPQFTTKPPEPYKLPDAQRKKLSKFLRKHFSGKEQTPDFQNRFWNKLEGSRDWVNRFWPGAVALMLLAGCAGCSSYRMVEVKNAPGEGIHYETWHLNWNGERIP